MKTSFIWNLWDIIYQQYIYRRTYKMASRPTGLDDIVDLIDGYDAS